MIEEKNKIEDNKLAGCEKKAAEYLAGWQRARADLLNYKKEEMERIGEFLKYSQEEFILKVLPILDNFETAGKALPDDLKNNDNIKGLWQIKTQLEEFLKSQGVEEIKTIGEKFDPNIHEVVEEITEVRPLQKWAEVGSPPTIETGIVVEEIQKGYKINGRLLRPAKIKLLTQ